MDNSPDPVNHPPHYNNHPSGVECIEITRHENFNCGNAIKYIWRRNSKGSAIEDLEKAAYYINDEIKRLEKIKTEADLKAKEDLPKGKIMVDLKHSEEGLPIVSLEYRKRSFGKSVAKKAAKKAAKKTAKRK